jgi:hypothetical protein
MAAMTREYLLRNLREAIDAISVTLREMESDPNYSEAELRVNVAHAYHHLNTAWNARYASVERVEACSGEDFLAWPDYPRDLDAVTRF